VVRIHVPGWKTLTLKHLVLDFNGTLAVDGHLVSGVSTRIRELAERLDVHVITADTFGKADKELTDLPVRLRILEPVRQDRAKLDFVESLGWKGVVAIGNGRNDSLMLKRAVLGIAVLQKEGTAAETLLSADLVVPDVNDALDLLRFPLRLVATLRR